MPARISDPSGYIKHMRDGLVILNGGHPHPICSPILEKPQSHHPKNSFVGRGREKLFGRVT